jgi:hypothetical protein
MPFGSILFKHNCQSHTVVGLFGHLNFLETSSRFCIALFLITTVFAGADLQVQAKENSLLKGNVMEQDYMKPGGNSTPSLGRSDMNVDPFSPNVPTINLKKGGVQGSQANVKAPNLKAAVKTIDDTPAMQLAWDTWHKNLAENIFKQFDFFASQEFADSDPLATQISYQVTRDSRIINVRVVNPSTNPRFDNLIVEVIKSFSGNTGLLTFPAGSKRAVVEKKATFTQNYGVEGFRYTTGDKELVR